MKLPGLVGTFASENSRSLPLGVGVHYSQADKAAMDSDPFSANATSRMSSDFRSAISTSPLEQSLHNASHLERRNSARPQTRGSLRENQASNNQSHTCPTVMGSIV